MGDSQKAGPVSNTIYHYMRELSSTSFRLTYAAPIRNVELNRPTCFSAEQGNQYNSSTHEVDHPQTPHVIRILRRDTHLKQDPGHHPVRMIWGGVSTHSISFLVEGYVAGVVHFYDGVLRVVDVRESLAHRLRLVQPPNVA